MSMNISGNALVVGGGGGIGRACALLLAESGASGVMVSDLVIDEATDTVAKCHDVAINKQFQSKAFQVDVTREDSVRSLFREMVSAFGRIDYCVNCAGIGAEEATDIGSLSLADFQRFLDVNATGMFLVTREASIAMRAQEMQPMSPLTPGRGTTRGAIVNLASASSLVATAGVLPYTASKHAALGLTKNSGEIPLYLQCRLSFETTCMLTWHTAQALDNAAYQIRVNCVCPTWTDTPMVRQAMETVEGLADFIQGAVPIGRIAIPEEVADAVVFLCSPRSSYITGCSLIVDGGTTLTALR